MKKMKKVGSLLLALIMVFCMSTTVFAANTNSHTITIKNDKAGHTYSAYQVFKGDISNGKLTNIEWGAGVDGANLLTELKKNTAFAKCTDAESVADVVATLKDTDLDAFAKTVNGFLSTTVAASVSTKPYTMTVSGDGYYLVKDKAAVTGDDAATKIILKVVNDVEVTPKSSTPSIDKVIVNADDTKGNGTAQDVGSVVKFKLTSTIPAMDGYDTYKYVVNDTMSAGLTPVDADKDGKIDVSVTIGSASYSNFEVVQNGQNFTITFANLKGQKVGDVVEITYSATINENALTTDKETNTVNLQYSNDPNNSNSLGKTPDKTVYVYDFDIKIDKFAAGTKEKLAGAEFILYKMDGQNKLYYKYNTTDKKVEWVAEAEATKVVTDANGFASFKGLDSGKYYMHETAAPKGYNLLKSDVEVNITATYGDNGQITLSSAVSTDSGQYIQTESIENKSGAQLPATGGIGTTIFYILGGVLLVGAAVMLVARRRMRD